MQKYLGIQDHYHGYYRIGKYGEVAPTGFAILSTLGDGFADPDILRIHISLHTYPSDTYVPYVYSSATMEQSL